MIPVCNMATKDHHILNVQEDISKRATTSSGLKVVESESDLRRKSLPSIAPLNFEVDSAMEAPRSCSANDAYSHDDTPHMACLLPSIETKAAFEDNSPLLPSQADVKAKRLAKKDFSLLHNISLRDTYVRSQRCHPFSACFSYPL